MILDLGVPVLVALAAVALATGFLHGASGLAGGIVMAAVLAHFIGIKAAVPAMTVALIISHSSRAVIYSSDTDWATARRVLLFGGPMIVFGAFVFSQISPSAIAVIFALFPQPRCRFGISPSVTRYARGRSCSRVRA